MQLEPLAAVVCGVGVVELVGVNGGAIAARSLDIDGSTHASGLNATV